MNNKNQSKKDPDIIDKCVHELETVLTNHVGKFGFVLSVLGGVCSALIGMKLIIAGSVVMGITNVGICAGSVAYERLQRKTKSLIDENESLQYENQSLQDEKQEIQSQHKELVNLFTRSQNTRPDATPHSDVSTETYYEPVLDISGRFPDKN